MTVTIDSQSQLSIATLAIPCLIILNSPEHFTLHGQCQLIILSSHANHSGLPRSASTASLGVKYFRHPNVWFDQVC